MGLSPLRRPRFTPKVPCASSEQSFDMTGICHRLESKKDTDGLACALHTVMDCSEPP